MFYRCAWEGIVFWNALILVSGLPLGGRLRPGGGYSSGLLWWGLWATDLGGIAGILSQFCGPQNWSTDISAVTTTSPCNKGTMLIWPMIFVLSSWRRKDLTKTSMINICNWQKVKTENSLLVSYLPLWCPKKRKWKWIFKLTSPSFPLQSGILGISPFSFSLFRNFMNRHFYIFERLKKAFEGFRWPAVFPFSIS